MQRLIPLAAALALAACQNTAPANTSALPNTQAAPAATQNDFKVEEITHFNRPWAMTFLPDGRLIVSERTGTLQLFDPATGKKTAISGTPDVAYGGQGGLGDVVLHPDFANNQLLYYSYADADADARRGAVVARAQLQLMDDDARLLAPQIIWQQTPKVEGGGHYAHRIAFAADGHLFISSGERQKFAPAQDMQNNLGKILRLNDDGSIPADNPFVAQTAVAGQIWTLGHRNPLGMAFDTEGQLWVNEMGPKGGDELNRIVRGENYGYPIVSDGDHYDGRAIVDHASAPQYHAPAISWTPVISPSSMIFYSGTMFPDWQGRALIGGLSSQSLVVVQVNGENAHEQTRYAMGSRIREVEQGPDGALWLLTDGEQGRLLRLSR